MNRRKRKRRRRKRRRKRKKRRRVNRRKRKRRRRKRRKRRRRERKRGKGREGKRRGNACTGEWSGTWCTTLTGMRGCVFVWLVAGPTRKADGTPCCTGVCGNKKIRISPRANRLHSLVYSYSTLSLFQQATESPLLPLPSFLLSPFTILFSY